MSAKSRRMMEWSLKMANSAPQGISASIQESPQNVNPKMWTPKNMSPNMWAKHCDLKYVKMARDPSKNEPKILWGIFKKIISDGAFSKAFVSVEIALKLSFCLGEEKPRAHITHPYVVP